MKSLALKSIKALLMTILLAAAVHLAIIFFVFLSSGNWQVVSPVDFLGISTIDPTLRDSKHMFYISWAILAGMFLTALLLILFYKSALKVLTRAIKIIRTTEEKIET